MSNRLARAAACGLILGALAAPAAAQDRARPDVPALTNAETCLRAQVATAVRASSGAADAASFLVDYLCAEEVEVAATFLRNSLIVEAMKGMGAGLGAGYPGIATAEIDEPVQEAGGVDPLDPGESEDADMALADPAFDPAAMFAGLSVDPVTGELVAEGEASWFSGILDVNLSTQGAFPTEAPAFLRALAGRLVAAARP